MTTKYLNDTTILTLVAPNHGVLCTSHCIPADSRCIPADSRHHHILRTHRLYPAPARLVALQVWIRRTQLDVMRTVCYQPGPLLMPDLGEFSMEATAAA
jgi:hypothetical protein